MEDLIMYIGLGSILAFIILVVVSIISFIMRNGKGKKFLLFSILPIIVLVICLEMPTGDASESSEVQDERDKLIIKMDNYTYDKESDTLTVSGETNLPDDTKVRFAIMNTDETKDYVDNPIIQDGKFTAVFGDDEGELVANSDYQIDAMMYVNEDEYNTHFYQEYGEYSDVSTLVDGEVTDYDEHYVIHFGVLDSLEIVDAYTIEESDKYLEEYYAKEEEREKQELLAKKENAKEIRFAELEKNPEKLSGEFIKYQGEIVQIMEDETSSIIRLAVTKDSYGYDINDVIYITYEGTTEFVEEDVITVYGTILGSHTYESQAGHQITLPYIEAEIIE
ncbi:hypothetical protein [Metabacillus indicus]|uniref:hypothetical protein n=1 Tax=Metabacillus indicus TaxID=246786 RepID=UPI0004934B27|nr:hypothetical protein [Metabacillus indicus]